MGGQRAFHARAKTSVCPELHVMLCSLQQMSWNTVLCQRCSMLIMRPLEPAARTFMCMPSIRFAHYSLLPCLVACLHCCTPACVSMQNNLQSNLVQQKLRHIGTAHEAGLARPALCKFLHCDIIYSDACMTCLYPAQPPLQFKAVWVHCLIHFSHSINC